MRDHVIQKDNVILLICTLRHDLTRENKTLLKTWGKG